MIKEIQLVVCDIDGTLVQDDRSITPYTLDVLKRLHQHGVSLGIASGRSVDQQLYKQAEDWGLDFNFDVIIGMNGSELYDGLLDKREDFYKLKREWIKEIIELMEPFKLNPFMYYHDTMLTMHVDESTKRSSQRNHTDILIAEKPEDMYKEENAKIMFRTPLEMMPEVEAYVQAHPSPYYKAFKTQSTMLEFTDRRVSKAVSLEHFCKQNHIPLENVVAFGDMSNDNEMLKLSGFSVCLANGGEDTKALADDITEYDNNHDGFAYYVDKHILEPRGW